MLKFDIHLDYRICILRGIPYTLCGSHGKPGNLRLPHRSWSESKRPRYVWKHCSSYGGYLQSSGNVIYNDEEKKPRHQQLCFSILSLKKLCSPIYSSINLMQHCPSLPPLLFNGPKNHQRKSGEGYIIAAILRRVQSSGCLWVPKNCVVREGIGDLVSTRKHLLC